MTIRKGFTLIELLVVVAIIGILATVVVVNMSSAQNKARDANIKSNISTVKTAANLYYLNNGNYTGIGCTSTANVIASAPACDSLAGTQEQITIANVAKSIKSLLSSDGLEINATASRYQASAKLPSSINTTTPQSAVATEGGSVASGNSYDSGMIGWWKLTDRNDSGIYGFNGTLSDTGSAFSISPLPDGNNGNVLAITGTSGHFVIADKPELRANKFSYSLWFKRDLISDYRAMFSKNGSGNNPKFGVYALNTNSYYGLEVGNDTTGTTMWSSNATGLNTRLNWYHLVVTYDGTKFLVYHNGAVVLEQNRSYDPSLNTNPLRIGALWNGGNSLMGWIANARFYNRVLTANEAKALYDSKN